MAEVPIMKYLKDLHYMALLSLDETSDRLSIPPEHLRELIRQRVVTPYGGRARLGEPRFDNETIPALRQKIERYSASL